MQLQRWLTGIGLAVLVLGINFVLPAMGLCILIFLAALCAQFEVLNLLFKGKDERFCVGLGLATCAAVMAVSVTGSDLWLAVSFLVMLILCFVAHLFAFRVIESAHISLGKQLLGLFYVPLLASFFALVRLEPRGAWWVTVAMLVVFIGDTGAYYAGKTFGRHKLYPAVSPNKTVEGSIGGAGCSVVFGLIFQSLYLPEMSLWEGALLFLVLGLLGQVGDLFESFLKRSVGVKDSGRILPGHGGMLDRIDGALFAGAPMYLYLRLFQAG